MLSTYVTYACFILLAFLLFGLRYVVPGRVGDIERVDGDGDHKTLVVFGPPLGGRGSARDLEFLVRASFPGADFLLPNYANKWFSNSSPFEMASNIETAIREADQQHHYARIVLFGYSTGGLLLRKAYVWGHGFDDDRGVSHGRHPWVDRVERFVSLAAPNRGWPTSRPRNLRADQYVLAYVGQLFIRLTGTGQVVLEVLQGSRFVANMRVQWVKLSRRPGADMPLVVHLVGGKDELVDRDDSIDIEAAGPERTMTRTIEGLNHSELAQGIYKPDSNRKVLTALGETISIALTRKREDIPEYWPDKIQSLQTDPDIKQLIFVMHGIRDESNWPSEIRVAVEKKIGPEAKFVKVIPPQYRRFTMLPFLLYWDRQENVRWFMDQYTEAIARYPSIEHVDFIGHSNGTYILASALRQYSVLKVRNVFFAGSVVPIQYNWSKRIADQQVTGKVWNVCADLDWVVAILPQLFQQVSDWLKINDPATGLFDIGSAGFRGFRGDVGTEKLRHVKFISGTHSAAFDAKNPKRLDAIIDFVTSGDDQKLAALEEVKEPPWYLSSASNLSWLIWALALIGIVWIGILAYQYDLKWLVIYVLIVLGVVTSI